MAATVKRKRSSQKRRMSQSSNRYDKLLTKFKKMKKFGGSFLVKSKETGLMSPAHTVSEANPSYKGVTIVKEKKS